jgi:hypothetical protein
MKESRLWQAIGMASLIGGAIMLVVVYMKRSSFAEATAYGSVLAASFVMLAGFTGFIFGRVMTVIGGGDCKAGVWQGLGWLCIIGGTVLVGLYGYQSLGYVPNEHQMVRAIAGSFLLMTGIIALLGGRTIGMAMGGGKSKAAGA